MIKAKERPLESTSPQEKNSVAEPMKNVTVGECKPGKKKKKTKFKSVRECKSGKTPTQAWKKKKQSSKALENASLEKKKKQSSKAQENVTVGILKKSDDGKDIIKKD